jgi:hypothetical protein
MPPHHATSPLSVSQAPSLDQQAFPSSASDLRRQALESGFGRVIRESEGVRATRQLDPSFNTDPSVHSPEMGPEAKQVRQLNSEYLVKMWRETEAGLTEEEAAKRLAIIEQHSDLSSSAISDMREKGAQLNYRQTAYVLTLYGEPGTISTNGSFEGLSIHDCSAVTTNLTGLEKGNEVKSYSEIAGSVTGTLKDQYTQRMPQYRAYFDEPAETGDFVADLDAQKNASDQTKFFVAMDNLGYSPLSEKPGTFQLNTVNASVQVGDVLFAQEPLMKDGYATPSYHAMKVVGKTKEGEHVVMQIDAANPQGARLMTLTELQAAMKPETKLDVYRERKGQ